MSVNAGTRYSIPPLLGRAPWPVTVSAGMVQIDELVKAWRSCSLIDSHALPHETQCPIGTEISGLAPYQFNIDTTIEPGWWNPQSDNTLPQHGVRTAIWELWSPSNGYDKHLWAGVCKDAKDSLWMLLAPWCGNLARSDGNIQFPPLFDLRGFTLSWPTADQNVKAWYADTAWFLHRLDDPNPEWNAMVREVGWLDPSEQTWSDPSILFMLVNQSSRQARGTQYGGRPFTGALPFLETVPGYAASAQPFSSVALLTIGELKGSPIGHNVVLTRLLLGSDCAERQLRAHLDWAAPWRDRASGEVGPRLSLTGSIDPTVFPEQFIDWPLRPDFYPPLGKPSQQALDVWRKALAASPPRDKDVYQSGPDALLSFGLRLSAVSTSTPWIRMGSIEIQPLPDPGDDARLRISVYGSWTQNHADFYPVCTLESLPCLFRYAAGNDQSEDDARVNIDLARDSSPIVDADIQTARRGTLRMESRFGAGADAVVTMQITADAVPPTADEVPALWLNLTPFMVAQVGLSTDDGNSGGPTMFTWRSDDPQGAQWRVSGKQVKVTLPPQAVAEEMDRGDRFWTGSTSGLAQHDKPLRYRFSPPTSLTLQPSPASEGRRFELSPLNLLELVQGADVDEMTTELAYPLQVVYTRRPDSDRTLRLSETATFYGTPLPIPQGTPDGSLPPGLRNAPRSDPSAFERAVKTLFMRQSVSRANFVTRLAELWIHDPRRDRLDLRLDDVTATIRGKSLGAPALLNPLPVTDDIPPAEMAQIAGFLSDGPAWSNDKQSIHSGILYTFEIASELLAVLKTPQADSAVIEALSFSALGASGGMSASFDHSKTSFSIKVEHGQLSRLVKIRLGRIGALWNRARHVVVYERSAAQSQQFGNEQTDPALDRWPILRKTEEYVELLQPERSFALEPDASLNRAGFIDASVFISKRIYVNSAWARDLGTGYELPLWDLHAASVNPLFYPKPQVHLRCFGNENQPSRLWFEDPQQLYFYSSTLDSNTADTDTWPPVAGVDFDNLPRLPVLERRPDNPSGKATLRSAPPANATLCTSARFDLRVKAGGPVNLQHDRGSTPMLTRLQRLSIARSGQPSPRDRDMLTAHATVGPVLAIADVASKASNEAAKAAPDLERFTRDLLAGITGNGDCTAASAGLKQQIAAQAASLQTALAGDASRLTDIKDKLKRDLATWQTMFGAVVDDLIRRATAPAEIVTARADALRQRIAAAQPAIDATQDWTARRQSLMSEADSWRNALWSCVKDQLMDGTAAIQTLAQSASKALADARQAIAAHDLSRVVVQVGTAQAILYGAPSALKPVLEPLTQFCDLLLRQLQALRQTEAALQSLAATLLNQLMGALASWCDAATAALDALGKWAGSLLDSTNGPFGRVQAGLMAANDAASRAIQQITAASKRADILTALSAVDDTLNMQAPNGLLTLYRKQLSALRDRAKSIAADGASKLNVVADTLVDEASNALAAQPMTVVATLDAVIDDAAASCEKLRQKLESALGDVRTWVEQQAQTTLAAALSSEASARFASLAADVAQVWDSGASGLQLARCIGEVPSVTPLDFDIDCAAYVFDAAQKRIEMTPVLAYLRREGDVAREALDSLATITPHSALLDQLVLDEVQGLKLSDVFGKFAGMKLDGLFSSFLLPSLTDDQIKITHGFDAQRRRAWVNAAIDFTHDDRENVFDIGPIALGIEKTAFVAFSGVEVEVDADSAASNPPTTRTNAKLTADWLLDAGGQTLVRFKRVSLAYDGVKGFDFNIDPHDIELHPGLKFLTDFIARFSGAVPSWIDIDVADGRSVGVSASMESVVNLGDFGAVSIGPIDIRSRFGLTLKNGKFAILTTCDVGSREHPIFVQVSFLGGGVWMEARALYVDGAITPHVSIGACLGSMRSINLAGVAQAMYSIQLFCYIEVGNGTSIAVGLSMVGSARILGFVTANVSLLLEAHHENGVTEGTGRLDVSVTISWCYTFRYKQAVRHRF